MRSAATFMARSAAALSLRKLATSGTTSPTLGYAIAMAYVPPDQSAVGTQVEIGIRAQRATAEVIALPFYRRST